MSNRIPSTPRRHSQSETDTERSSLVSTASSGEQDRTSEGDSGKPAKAPALKTRQTGTKPPTNSDADTADSGAPPQAAMTSSSPTVKNRQTGEQKIVMHDQDRNLTAYERGANKNEVKKIRQDDVTDIQQAPKLDGRWERFTRAVNENGQLILEVLNENDLSELSTWLQTSPASLRELVICACDMGDAGAITLAKALRGNTTLTTLKLDKNDIGDTGSAALAEALEVNKTLTALHLRQNRIGGAGAAALAKVLQVNATLTTLNLNCNFIGQKGGVALAEVLQVNATLTTLCLELNFISNAGAAALAKALQVNKTLTMLELRDNEIGDDGAVALAKALQINKTLTTLGLIFNPIEAEGVAALADALQVNTALTTLVLDFGIHIDSKLKLIGNILERNKRLKLQPYAEASLDLLVRHSPALKNMGFPTDVLPLLAEQLPNEVLAVFEQEWRDAFRAPSPPIDHTPLTDAATTTTTTNATITTTTTTTTDSTIPTTLITSPEATATDTTSSPPPVPGPTATAAEINALLADPNPVVALSRWIDHQASPAAGLNWVDPANGYTLLHYAVAEQQGAVVRSLLARGIDSKKADHNNQTAAQLAKARADSSSSQTAAAIAALLQ